MIDGDPQGSPTTQFGYGTDVNSITPSTVMRQAILVETASGNPVIRHEAEIIYLCFHQCKMQDNW